MVSARSAVTTAVCVACKPLPELATALLPGPARRFGELSHGGTSAGSSAANANGR